MRELTPVQNINGIYYKRDDMFAPFGENEVNCGKVRQTIHMFNKFKEYINEVCNSTVICAVSVYSPTAPPTPPPLTVIVGAPPATLYIPDLISLSSVKYP